MKKYLLLLLLPGLGLAAETRAKNVILFLGDAGGIPTLNAAGIYAHDRPQSLFLQSMPYLALSDTSSLDNWVTDSAAGMTALVTGHKTNNGMLSLLPGTDGADGQPLKTILEYAEERGLATGVITNMPVWDATPAACYAHAASRKSTAEIFAQVVHPRFGDGVDLLIGADRAKLFAATQKAGWDALKALQDAHYQVFEQPADIPADATRAAAIYDGADFTPEPVVENAIRILARNPKGFFLMVEWDMHTDKWQTGLDRAIVMDEMVRKAAAAAPADTLILFAADHSFGLRLRGGKKNQPLAGQILADAAAATPSTKPVLTVENSHTGEEILVTGQGPGAERLHGFIPNSRIFNVMINAYGWPETP
jgi:alkaline phosphatase